MPPHLVSTRHASGDAVRTDHILMALVCGVLLACTVAPRVAAAEGTSSYTVTQQSSTLKFLQGFATPAWGLDTIWVGTDFCTWMHVTCTPSYATVTLDTLTPATTATLPELADSVDGSLVMVSQLSASGLGGRLNGTLPASWGRLSKLTNVTLSGNALSGTLPAEWASLYVLRTLNTSGNALSGSLPENWSQLSQLSMLSLGRNALSGSLPATWALLQKLQTVDLSYNQFNGTFPVDWYALPRTLSSLLLNNNQLSGSISVFLGYLSVSELDISNNAFCGCAPTQWNTSDTMTFRADPALRATDCSTANACDVHDSSTPEHSATLRFLQSFTTTMPALQAQWTGSQYCTWTGVTCSRTTATVDLSNVALTTSGSLPELAADVDESLVVVTQVRVVGRGSLVAGTLPASWSRLSQLTNVTLSGNALSGTLPAEWASLNALRTLNMSDNALSGSLPEDWSALWAVSVLSLRGNALNGSLPATWTLFRRAEALDLSYNQLSGTFPVDWYAMPRTLSSLLLNNNQLSGSISIFLGYLSVSELDISNNAFCGCAPTQWNTSDTMTFRADPALRAADCETANICRAAPSSSTSESSDARTNHGSSSSSSSMSHPGSSFSSSSRSQPGSSSKSHPGSSSSSRSQPGSKSSSSSDIPDVTSSSSGTRSSNAKGGGSHGISSSSSSGISSSSSGSASPPRCDVRGCKSCEEGSTTNCALCSADYKLTETKTCRETGDASALPVSCRSVPFVVAALCALLLL